MKKIYWEKLFVEIPKDKTDINNSDSDDVQMLMPMFRPQYRMNLFDRNVFYVGNTNFRIDTDTLSIIENIDGVETLNHVTPYKMVLSIAKLYEESIVLDNIANAINPEMALSEADLPKDALDAFEYLKNFKDWCIYVLTNKKVEYVCLEENEQEFADKLELLREACSVCGGLILNAEKTDNINS